MSEAPEMSEARYASAAVRVSAPTTSIGEIASLLPIVPSRQIDRDKSKAGESRWIYESANSEDDLETHIGLLLDLIERHRSSFEALPADCVIDIWCMLSTESSFAGFSLSRRLIERAAILNLEFTFSVYQQP
jgi:hypothetical protein